MHICICNRICICISILFVFVTVFVFVISGTPGSPEENHQSDATLAFSAEFHLIVKFDLFLITRAIAMTTASTKYFMAF